MQTTNTSVVARRVIIGEEFATLPYEAGWATEAVVFVQAEGTHPELLISVQVSPDGITWVPRAGGSLPADASIIDLPLSRFGNWLRVVVTGATPQDTACVLIHLNLKG